MFKKPPTLSVGIKNSESLRIGIFFFLLLLLVLLGDGKQAIVSVAAAAGILCMFIADRALSVKGYVLRKKQGALWAAVLLFLPVASICSISPGFSVSESLKYVFGFLVFVYFSRPTSEMTSERFGNALVLWTLLIVGISFLVTTFSGLQALLPNMNLLYKAYGHNHITGILMFVVPVVLERYRKKRNTITLLVAVCIGGALLYSFARGALILVSLYAAYYVFTRTQTRAPALRGTLFCLIAAIFAAGFYLFSYSVRITYFPPRLSQPVRKESLSESRTHYWKQAWTAFSQKPLTGWGPGTFYLLSKRFEDRPSSFSWYAHSFPLQVLAELGIFPFILLSLLLSTVFTPFFRVRPVEKKTSGYSSLLAEGATLVLLYSFVEINMDFIVVWMMFWAILGHLTGRFSSEEFADSRFVRLSVLLTGTTTALYYAALLSSYTLWLTPYHKHAFAAAPFVADNTLMYVSGSRQPLSRTERQIITALHGANPEILYVLAENVKQISPPESAAYFHSAVLADPHDSQYTLEFLQLLFDHPDLAAKPLLADMATPIYNTTLDRVNHKENTAIRNLTKRADASRDVFVRSVGQVLPGGHGYFFTKLYYAWGINMIGRDDAAAHDLLSYAASLAPEWSYFHLELASFYARQRNDAVAAEQALSACRENTSAGGHCEEFTVASLPMPGTFFSEILRMP